MSQRAEVFELDAGRCVACGKRQRANAGPFEWSCHHAIRQQVLRRHGVKPARIRDATYCALLCWDCHGAQTSCMAKVPLERLPTRVVEACDALGPWAQDALRRTHPSQTDTGRFPANPGGPHDR